MKTNLFIIGAGKSGTTSLWNFFNQHPQVCMCPTKEPSFFSETAHFIRGEDWYHALYDNYQGQNIIGEASNSYSATTTYPETAERIFKYNPSAKLIYIVRHPMQRTESDWMEANKRRPVSFSDFIRNDALSRDKNHYLNQYNAYRLHFPRKAILVLTFDQIITNFEQTNSDIFDFLEIEYRQSSIPTDRATADQQKRTVLFYWFNQSNLYAHVRRYIPRRLRKAGTWLTSRKYSASRPTWTETDKAWFEKTYRQVTEEFFDTAQIKPPNWQW